MIVICSTLFEIGIWSVCVVTVMAHRKSAFDTIKVQAPRRKGIRRGLRNWEKGPPNSGEGSSKLDRGQRRKLHPLGEYTIILIQMSLEIRPYAVLVEVNTAYWGFLGVGTMHKYAVSSLTDTTYRLSEQYLEISSFKLQNAYKYNTNKVFQSTSKAEDVLLIMPPKRTTTPMTDATIKQLIAQGVADVTMSTSRGKTSKDNEDPSWSTSFKTRRTQKTSSALEDFICVVFVLDRNIETATYGKIWYDEDVHDHGSFETEFPAIVFNDALTSEVALSCEPTISPLNDAKIDFRTSFDESDDEDYTVIYDENSFSYKIIYVNNLKTNSKNDNDKVNMPSFSSPEPEVSYSNDLDFFKDFENEFPAIIYNDALTSKLDFLTKLTISPQYIDEFNLKDETSLSECDEEEQNVLYFNDLFSFNVIYPDDLKLDTDNGNDEINIEQPSGDMSVIPLPNVINVNEQGSNKLLETSHDTSTKFFKTETFIKKLNVNIMTCNLLNNEMILKLFKNLYVPFGTPFDPKLFYKDGIKLGQVEPND
ncbi:hypothetical protein Tco_1315328 [Tanacetum coccineum]